MKIASLDITRARLLYVLLLFVVPTCDDCGDEYATDIKNKGDLKRANLHIDASNASVGVRNFDNSFSLFGSSSDSSHLSPKPGPDKRLCIGGKKKGPGTVSVGGREVTDRFQVGGTLAIDRVTGLVPGTTNVFVRTTGDGYDKELVATYSVFSSADGGVPIGGFVVEAFNHEEGAKPIASMDFPGVNEMDMRLRQTASGFTFLARPTPAPGGDTGSSFEFTMTIPCDPPTGNVGFSVGARAFEKGARIYYDNGWAIGPGVLGDPSSLEAGFTKEFGRIAQCMFDAKALLSQSELNIGDIQNARLAIQDAQSALASQMFSIKSQMQSDAFDENTQASRAAKQAKAAYKKTGKILKNLQKMIDSGDINPKKVAAACKCTEKGAERSVVGMANMQGNKSGKFAQIESLLYEVDPREVPDFDA